MEKPSRALRAAGAGRRAVGRHRRRGLVSPAKRRLDEFRCRRRASAIPTSGRWPRTAREKSGPAPGAADCSRRRTMRLILRRGWKIFVAPMPALLFLARRTLDRHHGGRAALSRRKTGAVQRNCRQAVWRRARHRAGQIGRAVVRHGGRRPGAPRKWKFPPVQKIRRAFVRFHRVPAFCRRWRAVDRHVWRRPEPLQGREIFRHQSRTGFAQRRHRPHRIGRARIFLDEFLRRHPARERKGFEPLRRRRDWPRCRF